MTKVPPEERILAALSHAAILISGPGLALPALLWATQRRKSTYLSFQTLQALGYQIFQAVFGAVILLLWMIGLIIMLAIESPALNDVAERASALAAVASFASVTLVILFLIIGLYALLGLVGAIACLLGKNFHYPWLGVRLEPYLVIAGECCTQHEEDWLAAMGHASILTPLWGILVPLVGWLACKERPQRLRFQSAQSFGYQLAGLIIWFILGALILLSLIPMLAVLLESQGISTGFDPATSSLALAPFFVTMLLTIIATLLMPIYSTLPIVAAYRILKGLNYQYPIAGQWARRVLRLDNKVKA
jgi:uncharacterized Tic20 family protein